MCSLFPKAILFDFYFTLLYLVLCRVAAVKSLPVRHHRAGYILFPLGSLNPSVFCFFFFCLFFFCFFFVVVVVFFFFLFFFVFFVLFFLLKIEYRLSGH